MTLYFLNPTVLSPLAITISGLSAKPESPNPFGRFGSGLKYAIAGILRLGGTIKIDTQEDGTNSANPLIEYIFDTQEEIFRGKFISFIYMTTCHNSIPIGDAQRLPFTTDLGAHWAPWMLYRELRSNAEDERGQVSLTDESACLDTYTLITIGCDEVEDAHIDRASFWLESEPLLSTANLSIHPGPTTKLFYQHIQVHDEPQSTPWRFSYSFTDPALPLTEDRTLAKPAEAKFLIAKTLLGLTDPELITQFLAPYPSSEASPAEWKLDFDWYSCRPTPELISAVLLAKSEKRTVPPSLWAVAKTLDPDGAAQATRADFPINPKLMLAGEPGLPTELNQDQTGLTALYAVGRELSALRAQVIWWKGCALQTHGLPEGTTLPTMPLDSNLDNDPMPF